MSTVNRAIIVGRLGGDPKIRALQGGEKMASFSMATSERWRDANGERKEKTSWHNVVVFNRTLVEVAEKYLRKGARCYVEGKMETRRYTGNDNVERSITEIVVGPFNSKLLALDRTEEEEALAQQSRQRERERDELNDTIPF